MVKKDYILARRRVYTGRAIRVDEVDLDFGAGRRPTYELVTFAAQTGVSALPVEGDTIYLLKHYQLGEDAVGYSLPTGGLMPGEDPEIRMNLELMEELKMKADSLELILRPEILPSYIGERPGYIYIARGLTPAERQGDEEFTIEVERLSLKTALKRVKQGDITDARTCLAILMYHTWYG